MSTIPASAIVNVIPNVLTAGGSALDLNGLILSTSTMVPVGSVRSFASQEAVAAFFGDTSTEAGLATKYFKGFDNSNAKPGAVLFAQYNSAAVTAWLQGADLGDMTLAELQALSGLLSVTIDGVVKSATINLSAATSFSQAAQLIQNALAIEGVQAADVTGSISGNTLTVSSVADGVVAVGQLVNGTGVSAGTYITAGVSGTGGTGTYTVNNSQSSLSQSLDLFSPGVEYSSVTGGFRIWSGTSGSGSTAGYGSGALATSLLLTQVTGAVLSQGAVAAVPGTFMNAVVLQTRNWASYMLAFDPDTSGNDNKLAFAAWTSGTNKRYAFICWDNDLAPAAAAPASSSLGRRIAAASYGGTALIGRDNTDYADLASVAAFICGSIASIDFEQIDGRTTLAFRSQEGLVASVSNLTAADNLLANGYNFYGAYATANDGFVFFYNGQISGSFLWLDSFVDQIWLNNGFQLDLMNLLTNAKSIPYNAAGNALIEAALNDRINAGLAFGAFRAGVTLSSSQRAAVNAAAGANVADTLQTRGWYLQVLPASPTSRIARESPPCTFWYTDGQSVQKIDLTSVAVL